MAVEGRGCGWAGCSYRTGELQKKKERKKSSPLLLSCCCSATEGIPPPKTPHPDPSPRGRSLPGDQSHQSPSSPTPPFLQSLYASFCPHFIRSPSITSLSELLRLKRGFVGFSKAASRFLTGRRMKEVCGHTCSCRPVCIITVKPDEESAGRGGGDGAGAETLLGESSHVKGGSRAHTVCEGIISTTFHFQIIQQANVNINLFLFFNSISGIVGNRPQLYFRRGIFAKHDLKKKKEQKKTWKHEACFLQIKSIFTTSHRSYFKKPPLLSH